MSSFGRLAAGPECDHQAGDDGAVGLNLDPVLVVAQKVAASQQVLELSEENFNCPSIGI